MSATPMSRALRGDEEGLYRTHQGRLLRLISADVSARPQVIEDACAYAWAELLARQPDRTSIVGWLRVVARREAIRLARVERVSYSIELFDEDEVLSNTTTPPPFAELQLHCEAREALSILAALRPRHRAVLGLHVAGYDYREIAAELGISRRSVERAMMRSRRHARAEAESVPG